MSTMTPDGHVEGWFARVIFVTAEMAGVKITETRTRYYAMDLQEFSQEQIESAFARVRHEGTGFFPFVADIRRQIMPSPDDAALLAWTALEQAAERVGAYQSIVFEDAATAEALLFVFGSWPDFCQCTKGPDLLVKRQQFGAAYRDSQRRLQGPTEPVRCAGLLDSGKRPAGSARLAMGRVTVRSEVIATTELLALEAAESVEAKRMAGIEHKEPWPQKFGQ